MLCCTGFNSSEVKIRSLDGRAMDEDGFHFNTEIYKGPTDRLTGNTRKHTQTVCLYLIIMSCILTEIQICTAHECFTVISLSFVDMSKFQALFSFPPLRTSKTQTSGERQAAAGEEADQTSEEDSPICVCSRPQTRFDGD